MNKIKPINISASFLSKVLKSGYDLAVAEKLGMIAYDTSSMQAGRAIHSMISESFGGKADKVVICPFDNYRTKASQEWRDSQDKNTIILKQSEADLYAELVDRIHKHPVISKLLDGEIKSERVVEKEINGLNVKGIIDLSIQNEAKTLIDWKFVSSQVFDDFGRKALWNNYDLQAAVYDFLEDATHIYFVTIESEAPHRIKAWYCDPSMLESGADKFNKALQIIKKEDWREPTFDIEEVDNIMAWGY